VPCRRTQGPIRRALGLGTRYGCAPTAIPDVQRHALTGRGVESGPILDSRGVMSPVWHNRLFVQAFPGVRLMRHPWKKLLHTHVLQSFKGVDNPGIAHEPREGENDG
jgi:hypothetical protein